MYKLQLANLGFGQNGAASIDEKLEKVNVSTAVHVSFSSCADPFPRTCAS